MFLLIKFRQKGVWKSSMCTYDDVKQPNDKHILQIRNTYCLSDTVNVSFNMQLLVKLWLNMTTYVSVAHNCGRIYKTTVFHIKLLTAVTSRFATLTTANTKITWRWSITWLIQTFSRYLLHTRCHSKNIFRNIYQTFFITYSVI